MAAVLRGVGRAHGAVSFVNALLGGEGCAAAIELGAAAEVELEECSGNLPDWTIPTEADTPLVRAALAAGAAEFGGGRSFRGTVSLRSTVPPARGLKSSSAVVGAILRSLQDALSAPGPRPTTELASIGVRVHRALGLTATGGFDDALVALEGGVVAADNRSNRRLFTTEVPSGWSVLLALPPGTHPPASSLQLRFLGRAPAGTRAMELARRGGLIGALQINTAEVEAALGLSFQPLRAELVARGALGVGVAGLGPALAVIGPRDRFPEWREQLSAQGIESLATRFQPGSGAGL
ncbi:MAG TPA: hypothetical protein VGU43_02780 [Thermoplasmata archaeon]|nr:hypothetical protein [Thermoplasmata archaeon]